MAKTDGYKVRNGLQGTKIFKYCTYPAGRVTYNFHMSCIHMHMSFKSVCNKEQKTVICNMSSMSSSQSTRPIGRVLGRVLWKNYSSFLDFTRNYEWTSGIFVPWTGICWPGALLILATHCLFKLSIPPLLQC